MAVRQSVVTGLKVTHVERETQILVVWSGGRAGITRPGTKTRRAMRAEREGMRFICCRWI